MHDETHRRSSRTHVATSPQKNLSLDVFRNSAASSSPVPTIEFISFASLHSRRNKYSCAFMPFNEYLFRDKIYIEINKNLSYKKRVSSFQKYICDSRDAGNRSTSPATSKKENILFGNRVYLVAWEWKLGSTGRTIPENLVRTEQSRFEGIFANLLYFSINSFAIEISNLNKQSDWYANVHVNMAD